MGERLHQCDVSRLVRLPYTDQVKAATLVGTPKQVYSGNRLRTALLEDWESDLPDPVYRALLTITDATFWFANTDLPSSEIKWPESWLAPDDPLVAAAPSAQSPVGAKLSAESAAVLRPGGHDIEEFERYARKAAMSPELAYLTMMALLYRQTRDERVLAFFRTSREKVQAHLDAIDKIARV
jgi:hypothetical protein